jgi:hypothetical protein
VTQIVGKVVNNWSCAEKTGEKGQGEKTKVKKDQQLNKVCVERVSSRTRARARNRTRNSDNIRV